MAQQGNRLTKSVVAQALQKGGGLVSTTALLLACSQETVRRYLRRFPDLRKIREHAMSEALDVAEGGLIAAVYNQDPWAIRFLLRTQGKSRGYTYRDEHTGADGAPLAGAVLILPDNGRDGIPARNPVEENQEEEVNDPQQGNDMSRRRAGHGRGSDGRRDSPL